MTLIIVRHTRSIHFLNKIGVPISHTPLTHTHTAKKGNKNLAKTDEGKGKRKKLVDGSLTGASRLRGP